MPGVCVPPTGRKSRTMTTQAPETEVLNPEAPSVAAIGDSSPADSRCQHRYANGKRCRLPAKSSHSGLCKTHSQRKPKAALLSMPSDFDDLSEDLLRGLSHFRSSEDLREFLLASSSRPPKAACPPAAPPFSPTSPTSSCIPTASSKRKKRNWTTSPSQSSSICLAPSATGPKAPNVPSMNT